MPTYELTKTYKMASQFMKHDDILHGEKEQTIVANVTDIETRDALLKLISIAVPRAVGTTVKGKVHL